VQTSAVLSVINYTLRAKIILACLLVALIPVSLVLGVGLTLQWQADVRNASQSLLAAAAQTALRADSFILTTREAIRVEAQLPVLIDYLSLPPDQRAASGLKPAVEATLRALSRKDSANIISYALIDQHGVNLVDTDALHEGDLLSSRDYVVAPLATGRPYVSPVRLDQPGWGPSMDFSGPIRDASGAAIGVLRVRYSAVVLQQIVLDNSGLGGDRSFAILLDDYTIQLAHGQNQAHMFKPVAPLDPTVALYLQADGRLPGGPVESLSAQSPEFAAGLEASAIQPVFVAPLADESGGVTPYQLAVSPLSTQPWRIVFAQPRDVFLASLMTQARILVWLALGLMAAVAGAALLVARWLAGPIVHLTAVAAQVSHGDFTARAVVETRDEIGALAATFNSMTGQVRELVHSLEQRVVERQQAEDEIRRLNASLEQRVRERTGELEAANKELESFSYSISHDLRAPLRAMSGYASLLLTEHSAALSPEPRRYLSLIQTNTRQMSQLLEALVLFVSLGRKPLRRELVRPAELARQALDELAPEQAQRQVNVTIDELPPCQGDPMLLKQVYFHLLSNALKFTRRRDVARITVGCQLAGNNGRVVYFVRDNGVGFDMQYAHKLFGVFQRLHRPEDYEGAGAGLAIIQRILRRHGGRAWAEAEVDRGATFYFTL
jgi:signal transduction histidine kinase